MRQNRGINRTFAPNNSARWSDASRFPTVYYQTNFIRHTTTGTKPTCNDFSGTEPHRTHRARRGRKRLHDAHPHPGTGHPARTRGPRFAGLRPDRHGQNGGFHAAHTPAAHRRAPHQRAPQHPGAGAYTDARAGNPNRRMLPRLRPPHGHPPLRDFRRRQPAAAGRGAATRHRPAGRHAGTAVRPDRAGLHLACRHPLLRARRGRPHARHGLYPRHQAHSSAASP